MKKQSVDVRPVPQACALVELEEDGTIQSVSDEFLAMIGYERPTVVGRRIFGFIGEEEGSYTREWRCMLDNDYCREVIVVTDADGGRKTYEMTLHALKRRDGSFECCIGIFRENKVEAAQAQELYSLAFYDEVTHLPNRILFFDRLHHAIRLAEREGRLLGILYFDLDDFKAVNDAFGHDFGDQLLCEVARRIEKVLRKTDTVARLGGDEFVVLLEQIGSDRDVTLLAQRLLDVITEPVTIERQTLYISASIGVTLYPRHDTDARTLLKKADRAMYEAKESGKNQFRFFKENAGIDDSYMKGLMNDLSSALEYNEFFLLFQPQYDLQTGKYLSAEVLIRWQHPRYGLVSPSVFIPLAEMNGMINPITERILMEVSERFKTLDECGFSDFSLSVNISPRTLYAGDFVRNIFFFLDHYYLPPHRLHVEITENTFMKKIDDLIHKLKALRRRGVSIEIDDYGTGFTSLNYLINLPVDTLKIDRAFVRGIDGSGKDRSILAALIQMAHSLELEVVAEGAESEGEVETLRRLGCDRIQGFYYSRAVTFEALLELLKKDN